MSDDSLENSMFSTMESTMSEISQRDGPVADETVKEGTEGKVEGGPPPTEGQPSGGPPTSSPTVRVPPKAWAKEMHEHFSKLDPAVQEYIEKREGQTIEGLMSYKERADYAKKLQEVIEPFRADIQQLGLDEFRNISLLLNAQRTLRTAAPEQKIAMFQKLADDYGVDLGQLTVGRNEPVYEDPALVELKKEVGALKSTLTASQQAQQQTMMQKIENDINVFKADPAHPYFDEVAENILLLLSDPRETLEGAYEKAVWANPVTRAKELARTNTEAQEKLKKDAEEKAAEALKAKGIKPRGTEATRSPSSESGGLENMENTLKETFRAIQARV